MPTVPGFGGMARRLGTQNPSLRKYLNKLFYSILSRSLLRSEEASSFNHATLAQNPVSAFA